VNRASPVRILSIAILVRRLTETAKRHIAAHRDEIKAVLAA
jgi:hypothetical protein